MSTTETPETAEATEATGSKIEVAVRCPKPPQALSLELPGGRGHPMALSRFTDEELDAVALEYGAALKKRAAEQRKDEADPPAKPPKAPKPPAKKRSRSRS